MMEAPLLTEKSSESFAGRRVASAHLLICGVQAGWEFPDTVDSDFTVSEDAGSVCIVPAS